MPRSGTGRIYQRTIYVDANGKPCRKSDPGATKRTLPTWWIQYGHRGKTYRESSGSPKKRDAVALLNKRRAEIGAGKLVGPTEERVTLDDLVNGIENDYEINERASIDRMRRSFKHLRSMFAGNRALDITTPRIKKYITFRQAEGAANATIQQELAHLKRAFNLAVEDNLLSPASRPHVPSVKVKNAREGFFEPADLERVIAELPEPLRPVVRFAYLTGWRKGEILPLKWSQVDFDAGEVRIYDSKNDEGRTFPFGVLPPLKELLEEQGERTRALERERGEIISHVFHRNGKPIRSMRNAWNGACERAGLEGWLFHDLRRSAVRNLEAAGVPRSVAMTFTGHKTESVYRRYAIVDKKGQEEGAAKLARHHAESYEKAAAERTVVPIREAQG